MKIKTRLFTCLLPLIMLSHMASAQVYAPSNDSWKYNDNGVSVANIAGKEALRIASGKATLQDIKMQNGTIEFDVYLPGERAFAYLYFRGESEQEYESFYIRTHKSKAPDALQYSPVFQGKSAWQLYHGDKGTAAAAFEAEKWTHVKIELQDERMAVWIGNDAEPAMRIAKLGRATQSGWLALRGFIPRTSDAEFSAYFSAITLTPDKNNQNLPTKSQVLDDSVITKWKVSPAFTSSPGPIFDVPAMDSAWTTPPIQADGTFEFLRSRPIPDGARHWSVAADATLLTQNDTTCEMHFGFSDEITVLLNNQPILYQDASYRFADNRQQGVMHPDQVVAYLPLKAGMNQLRVIVSDRFGGWALFARHHGCTGVTAH